VSHCGIGRVDVHVMVKERDAHAGIDKGNGIEGMQAEMVIAQPTRARSWAMGDRGGRGGGFGRGAECSGSGKGKEMTRSLTGREDGRTGTEMWVGGRGMAGVQPRRPEEAKYHNACFRILVIVCQTRWESEVFWSA